MSKAASQAECRRFEPVHPLSSKPFRILHLGDTPDRLRAATHSDHVNKRVNKRVSTESVVMPRTTPSSPTYKTHTCHGDLYAYTRVDGRRVSLGRAGTPEALSKYRRILDLVRNLFKTMKRQEARPGVSAWSLCMVTVRSAHCDQLRLRLVPRRLHRIQPWPGGPTPSTGRVVPPGITSSPGE